MEVEVKTLTGETTNIRVDRDETVKEFKSRIQLTSISLPCNLQELYYNGEALDNESMMKECNIEDGSQVDVRMKTECLELSELEYSSIQQSESSQKSTPFCNFC